ncbi:hypothetical protein F5B22DRAFT_489533 [Xylaria bambusicola]|uniref:uncharacterized protein n=1 Tax=Xylaria bambusicola TaxID=326684 RepID=UPI002007C7B6|nr:uncharacterized protein F5B22DRAFT_489533 [Xylaria bambusicola]KAI0505967.1 hypothetical protein F5B22DRAFT_489533 [Xylaria bambusicola]
MAGSAGTSSVKPEYQHFVPQFILRNFAHKYTGPQRSKKGKKKKGDNMFRGELVVNTVNLGADPFDIEEAKVKRVLGQYDMYQDTTLHEAQRREIETMLGKLEAHVSTIFRKITKAFDSGEPNVWVTRGERNSIRKFLFILKYRGSGFHRRFNYESSDQYDYNDKELLQKYMEEKGFKRPIDVWFQGLKTIINLKMDADGWEKELADNMYLEDAKWFLMHTQMMYMAILAPEDLGAEFILTDNSYNIYEGPSTVEMNPLTGVATETKWTNLHEFAPLSPKLMIVLRSLVLPIPEEDSDPKLRAWREETRKMAGVDRYSSTLADLPISKPRNSYSEVVNGQVRLRAGEDGARRKTDKFCFQFFSVGVEHVHKINHILFDNAYSCTNIVFYSEDSFSNTLEWYMTNTDTLSKAAGINSAEQRRRFLVNLATLMRRLGSTKEPVWAENTAKVLSDFEKMKGLQRSLQSGLLDWLHNAEQKPETSSELPQGPNSTYFSIGGTRETLLEDMNLVKDMWRRRVDVDVESRGQPEPIRNRNRERLVEEFMTYPSRRVLFYSGLVRENVLMHHDDGYMQRRLDDILQRQRPPEYIIAKALHGRMSMNKLNWLIYRTAMNDIEREKEQFPEDELWETPLPSIEGAFRLALIGKIVFLLPGLLKNCGIPEIERLAAAQEEEIQHHDLKRIRGLPYRFIPDDQKIELLTRIMVRPLFREVLADKVEASLLPRLEDVFFRISFPTPPI